MLQFLDASWGEVLWPATSEGFCQAGLWNGHRAGELRGADRSFATLANHGHTPVGTHLSHCARRQESSAPIRICLACWFLRRRCLIRQGLTYTWRELFCPISPQGLHAEARSAYAGYRAQTQPHGGCRWPTAGSMGSSACLMSSSPNRRAGRSLCAGPVGQIRSPICPTSSAVSRVLSFALQVLYMLD